MSTVPVTTEQPIGADKAHSVSDPVPSPTAVTQSTVYTDVQGLEFSKGCTSSKKNEAQDFSAFCVDLEDVGPKKQQSGKVSYEFADLNDAHIDDVAFSPREGGEGSAVYDSHGGTQSVPEPYKSNNDTHFLAESTDDEFALMAYVFPRIDPALADDNTQSANGFGLPAKGANSPPNCVERAIAYLLLTDVRVALYFFLLILCTVFMVVAIPTSQIDLKEGGCYTYWGYKVNCDSFTYTTPTALLDCKQLRTSMKAAAGFSIITLTTQLTALMMCIIVIFCFSSGAPKVSFSLRRFIAFVSLFGWIMQLISWALVAGVYVGRFCESEAAAQLPRETAYGVGFGLCVTSWLVYLIAIIILIVPRNTVCCDPAPSCTPIGN